MIRLGLLSPVAQSMNRRGGVGDLLILGMNEPQTMADGHRLIRESDQTTNRSRAIRRIQRRRGFAIAGFAIAPWLLITVGIFAIFYPW
jgi:hypothetical protein